VLGRISALLPGCLQAERHTVQFQRAAPYWLDLNAFGKLEALGNASALTSAVELYRGEFMEGLYLEECPEFETWLVGERERWRQRVTWVLGELVAHHVRRSEHGQGLRFARRLLELEPWREQAHRQVMRLLAESGERGEALAQYAACQRALAEELSVEPAVETTRLYQQIRDGEFQAVRATPAYRPAQPPSFLDQKATEVVERPVFVARECELARLSGFLDTALAGQGRVVFVTGDAGQGKTALLQEFTRRAQATHPDLVVAEGNGNAHTGIGDPYLPFREALGLLTGDVEARWSVGAMSREQARRLWHTLPLAVQALLEAGPDLIGTLLPGAALVGRALAFAPVGADWLPPLEKLVERQASAPSAPGPRQSDLFEQYSRVLRALASQRPLLLVLDDLQWADAGSVSLLFHLGRRIKGSRRCIVSGTTCSRRICTTAWVRQSGSSCTRGWGMRWRRCTGSTPRRGRPSLRSWRGTFRRQELRTKR
jgi:DNA-binding SARP family transcriptional activator